MKNLAYHPSRGFPRCDCGILAERHRVEHAPIGNPCSVCQMSATQHRAKPIRKGGYAKGGKHLTTDKVTGERRRKTDKERTKFIGIDGEGAERFIDGKDSTHEYFMLAASYEDGSDHWVIQPEPGKHRLSTKQCLDMILSLPSARTKIFSFAFNYDLTKMLMDLDNESLFLLFRPELRKAAAWSKTGIPIPVQWEGYELNLQGTKFSVKRDNKRIVIWDLFKFFQGKFVTALRDWKIGDEDLWNRMQKMKDQRSIFKREDWPKILDYCLEETRCMAQLARKLLTSHEEVGLELRSYFGAGSSGGAMLKYMGIKEKIVKAIPEMESPVSSAFFGGRFENSVIGDIRESLTNWDIASAYVYQLAFLPCLEHGTWVHTKSRKDLETCEAENGALVRYALGSDARITGWGPFPFRTKDGTKSFPIESGGGWVWLNEYLQGERIWPHVHFREAWIYKTNCGAFGCDGKPFKAIPKFYQHRLELGKEGPGLVIKLGMNSCYGKLAQSVGSATYNSWIWAGMITSGCRAQLLELLALHKNHSNVLMLATDGLLTKETINPPKPLSTSTGGLFNGEMKSPLGGWESKPTDKGMFIARPGIYFPLNPTEKEIKAVRARGVGRSVVLEYWKQIVECWEKDGEKGICIVDKVPRFCGAKTSISYAAKKKKFKRAAARNGIKPRYGQWVSREIGMAFDPKPKRECVHPDGIQLILKRFPNHLESVPYSKAKHMFSQEAQELQAAGIEMLEQPEGDLTLNGFNNK